MVFALPPSEARSRREPIQEDMGFQRHSWLAERLSWSVIGIAIVLAFLGVFGGSGWLSGEVSAAGTGLSISYDPIVRRQAPAELYIDTASAAVTFDAAFEDYLDIQSITPPPVNRLRNSGIVYTFASASPRRIVVSFKPKTMGWFDAKIAAGEAGSVRFRQFSYP